MISASSMGTVKVRSATPTDVAELAKLRTLLWPEGTLDEHTKELASFLDGGWPLPSAVFVAQAASGGLVGFSEVAVRPHAEGCLTDRVGYLEGWFVVEPRRRQGIGRRLVAVAEDWARGESCVEFASDTEVDNQGSKAAHSALGFEDVGLVQCFRKELE